MHPCWHGRSTRSIFDHRETVMGLCRLPRTVCESVGERWRDGSGSLLILGYPVTTMLAHMLARVVDAVDFRPSRNGDGTVPAAAHSLRECRGAMARRLWQLACLGVSGHTDGCTRVGTGGRRGRSFDHREAAARIEPVDVRTCMRMPVRLCAKEYRFETSGEMWHGESCGYRRMSS